MSLVSKAAAKYDRPYWILPQTFLWPGSRVPTPAEYRNLCYVGLINGAKGVMSWSIYHRVDPPEVRAKKKAEGKPAWEEWYLPDSHELWAECGAVGKELKAIAPFILDGKRTKLTEGTDISAALWVKDRDALLIVANLSETTGRAVALTLPKEVNGELKAAFPERASSLTRSDGKLQGEIGKCEVQVYRISLQ
jgi:hypothetical protein